MSSAENYSARAPAKNWKRKRSLDETEENSESSMQHARRRYKKEYESTTLDDRIVSSVESHDERFSKGSSKSNHKSHSSSRVVQEYCHGIERKSPETLANYSTSHTKENSSNKPMIRILTPKEINCFSSVLNESSNDSGEEVYYLAEIGRTNYSSSKGIKASAASTTAKPPDKDFLGTKEESPTASCSSSRTSFSKVESTTRRSSGRPSGDRPVQLGTFSMIKKILHENKRISDMSSEKNCASKKRDDGEYSNRESASQVRSCSPSQSRRLHGTSLGENEDSDRYKGPNFSRKGNRASDSNIIPKPQERHSLGNKEESYDTPPVSIRISSSKYKQVESPTERSESRSESRRNSGISRQVEPQYERSSEKVSESSSRRDSNSSVIRKGRSEKKSSRMFSSRSHSSSSRRSDHHSTSRGSRHSPSKSRRPHVSRKGEDDDLYKLKGRNSSNTRRRVSEMNNSSKPEETDLCNSKEESSKATCISSRMSFTRMDSSLNSSENSEESTSSNSGESLPSREEPNWEESHTPRTSDEYSLSWNSEETRNVKKSPDKLIPSHTKKRDSDRLCTMTVTYKNRYFSPTNSKGSLSTPRRDRYSPRKYKHPSSTPRKGNKESDSYQRATPWVGDFMNSKEGDSDTPRSRPKIPHPKFSRGPFLCTYQLLGDSLLVRFADQILNNKAVIGENGKYCNGLCVSGQTIDGLIQKVLNCSLPLEPKVIVLIGTNDFLKGSTFNEVKSCMLRLLDILKKRVSEILLLTVPPIPRLKMSTFWDDWEKYNGWIKELHNGTTITVLDTARLYLKKSREPDLSCYERFMGYGARKRTDLIHLNKGGLKLMHREILNYANKMK